MANNLTTLRGNPSFPSGSAKFGSGGFLGGSGVLGHATVDNFLAVGGGDGVNDGTAEAWIKTTNSSFGPFLAFGRQGMWWVGLQAGKLVLDIANAAGGDARIGAGGPTISDGNFHHVAVTFTAATDFAAIYVDGALVETSTVRVGTSGAAANKFTVGGFEDVALNAYDLSGSIDELRLSSQIRYTGASFTVPTTAFGNSA